MVSVAVIGAGQWGTNHIRIFHELGAEVFVYDPSKAAVKRATERFNAKPATLEQIFADDSITAVSVCTPATTHFSIVSKALNSGKDVLVEKPLATSLPEAEKLVELAENNSRVLQVGHVFRYNEGIKSLKKMVENKDFGRIYLIQSSRLGLRTPRTDCGVVFDFAVHDFDILSFLLSENPEKLVATGKAVIGENEDMAFITLYFPSGTMGQVNVSWLTPNKIRQVMVVGEKKSAIFDDVSQELSVYDKGIVPSYDSYGNFKFLTHEGGITKPALPKKEPLRTELESFLDCVKNRARPLSDSKAGKNAVKVVEASLKSISSGKSVALEW